jgi:glycosyltransferase involved in cell wall biosynthesis
MPTFNEENGLEQSVQSLKDTLRKMQIPSEILIVDDCSTDGTREIAERLSADSELDDACGVHVRTHHHPTNLGIGGGMKTGMASARGEWLILIPADLAMDPGELSEFVQATPGADVVVGIRSDRRDYTPIRRFISWANIKLIRFLFRMPLRQFQYISMYRTEILSAIDLKYWRSAFFHAEVLIKARDLGCRMVEVEVEYQPRSTGRATGARWDQVVRTGRDMMHYWGRRVVGGATRWAL